PTGGERGGRSALDHHPEGLLPRADRSGAGVQLAQHQGGAVRRRRGAAAAIGKVNEAIRQRGENYFKYRQIEMLPDIAPVIADALAKARLITISGGEGGGAANGAANNIAAVIQTVLATQ